MKKNILLLAMAVCASNFLFAQCLCVTKTATGWSNVKFSVNGKLPATYSCGYQFSTNTKDTIRFVNGAYNCVTTTGCKATYQATLYKGDVVVNSIYPFSFTTGKISFPSAGYYKLVLMANCDKVKCRECVYYYTITY